MLYPGDFAEFTGFSETEVKRLCKKNKMSFDDIKAWYDGYELSGEYGIYNPYSVISACREKNCCSFWGKTSASETLTDYIDMDFDGLQETVIRLIGRSRKLLSDTIAGNGDAVAAALEDIRGEQYAPQYYNDEQALRAVVKYAYIVAFGQYVKVEEMPSGRGIADVVFIPVPLPGLLAMVIELKWNKTSGGAIAQITNKKYTAALKPFVGNILLVGINYDEKTGKHTCSVEKV